MTSESIRVEPGMSTDDDSRRVLANAILDAIRDSVPDDTPYVDRDSLTYTCIDGRVDMLAAVDALRAIFLVVPRSDIVGTEYGWRLDAVGIELSGSRASVITDARKFGGDAVERPVLPWSPIPLPEDGEPAA